MRHTVLCISLVTSICSIAMLCAGGAREISAAPAPLKKNRQSEFDLLPGNYKLWWGSYETRIWLAPADHNSYQEHNFYGGLYIGHWEYDRKSAYLRISERIFNADINAKDTIWRCKLDNKLCGVTEGGYQGVKVKLERID